METITKRLIWLYFFLLIFEGVLRKWITPGLSAPLLIIRDPVVLGIYLSAFMGNMFVMRGPLLLLVFMSIISVVFAMVAQIEPVVMLYGLRINYLHVPLIFVMADALNRDDVLRFGRTILIFTLPITLLMVAQYFAGERSWLNVGAGGELDSQLRGALGRVRPAGPFSFTTGPALWFPIATAFAIHGWLHRGSYPRWLLAAATGAIVISIPISISRTLMFSVLIVAVMGGFALMRTPSRILSLLVPLALITILGNTIGGGEITESFNQRWVESTSSGIQTSIIDRFFGTYLESLDMVAHTPLWGLGIGMGSNVGAHFAFGEMGFHLAESEWSKIILELGPILGWGFILFRCWLTLKVFFTGLNGFYRHGDSLPWLLAGSAMLPVLSGQWAPPTILGFAVFSAGLTLTSAKYVEDDEAADEMEDEQPGTEEGMLVDPETS